MKRHTELAVRLADLANKWLREQVTVDQIKESIVQEQLLNSLAPQIRVWVKERRPKSSLETGQLADDYVEARKQTKEGSLPLPDPTNRSRASELQKGPSNDRPREGSGVTCYKCGKPGHISTWCPSRAMYCGHGYQDKHCVNVLKAGWVEDHGVADILLDTGCSKTLVHQKLVPKEKYIWGEAVTIRCAHGDSVIYPVAKVNLVVDRVLLEVEAAVSPTLPVSVLLGTDVPVLSRWLRGSRAVTKGKNALMTVTRAGARRMEEEKRKQEEKEKASQVRPNMLSAEMDEGENDRTIDTVEESGDGRQEEEPSHGGSTESQVETDKNVGIADKVGEKKQNPGSSFDEERFVGGRVREKNDKTSETYC